jgi:hypothetical protein
MTQHGNMAMATTTSMTIPGTGDREVTQWRLRIIVIVMIWNNKEGPREKKGKNNIFKIRKKWKKT